jgi:hypothetical protein
MMPHALVTPCSLSTPSLRPARNTDFYGNVGTVMHSVRFLLALSGTVHRYLDGRKTLRHGS